MNIDNMSVNNKTSSSIMNSPIYAFGRVIDIFPPKNFTTKTTYDEFESKDELVDEYLSDTYISKTQDFILNKYSSLDPLFYHVPHTYIIGTKIKDIQQNNLDYNLLQELPADIEYEKRTICPISFKPLTRGDTVYRE